MEADRLGLLRVVKVIGRHSFLRVSAQLFPIVSLREYAFRQAFSDKPTIGFLVDFKNDFLHRCSLFYPEQRYKAAMRPTEIIALHIRQVTSQQSEFFQENGEARDGQRRSAQNHPQSCLAQHELNVLLRFGGY